jgi:hypothetical protein
MSYSMGPIMLTKKEVNVADLCGSHCTRIDAKAVRVYAKPSPNAGSAPVHTILCNCTESCALGITKKRKKAECKT